MFSGLTVPLRSNSAMSIGFLLVIIWLLQLLLPERYVHYPIYLSLEKLLLMDLGLLLRFMPGDVTVVGGVLFESITLLQAWLVGRSLCSLQ